MKRRGFITLLGRSHSMADYRSCEQRERLFIGVDRKSSADSQNVAVDPKAVMQRTTSLSTT
jgi:hypothetical protein